MIHMKNIFLKLFFKFTLAILGVLAAGLGIKGFLLPNNFIDGGVTGVSMLLSHVTKLELPILIVLINLPFVFLAFKQISWKLALASICSIVSLALALEFINFPEVTTDKLLASIFGGASLGAGIGMSIRAGSVLDGTEVLALIFSKKVGATVGDIILLMNIFIFGISFFVFGIEPVMYSILTYFSASRTIDFVIHGLEEYTGITIISSLNDQIKQAILEQTGRGVTVYKGKGGFSDNEQDILFCVVTRLEISKIKSVVEEVDPAAFTFTHALTEASGGMVRASLRFK